MELTGKCKEKFEEYLLNNDICCVKFSDGDYIIMFDTFIDSMKYSVIEDFFDLVGIQMLIEPVITKRFRVCLYFHNRGISLDNRFDARPEARTAAIEKANQIFNER